MSFLTLPDDVILLIFERFLGPRDISFEHPIISLNGTCRRFRRLVWSRPKLIKNEHVMECQVAKSKIYRRQFLGQFLLAINGAMAGAIRDATTKLLRASMDSPNFHILLGVLQDQMLKVMPWLGSGLSIPEPMIPRWIACYQGLFGAGLGITVIREDLYQLIGLSIRLYGLVTRFWIYGA